MSIAEFTRAQQRALDRYGVEAGSRLVHLPLLEGDAHVLEAGEGPPVLMVIGGGIVAGAWAPLMAELDGFSLYAVDLPGQGLSDPLTYRAETFRSTGVTFLAQLIEALHLESPPLVGQSIGGLWATWLALDHPDRVTAISYIACPALMLGTAAPLPLRLGTNGLVHRLFSKLAPPSREQTLRMAGTYGQDLRALPEMADLLLAYQQLPGSADSLLALHRSVIRLRGARPGLAITESQLSAISQPTQLIWGEDDTFGPPGVGERAARIMANSEFHAVKGGHAPWFDSPEQVAGHLVPFLERHVTRAPG